MPITNNGEINTNVTSKGNFTIQYQDNGYGGVIPIINGEPHQELMMGYVSPEDKLAGLKLLEKALNATNGNIPQAMQYMYSACLTSANGIKADEVVTVEGVECILDYTNRTISTDGEVLASMEDIDAARPDVVKALLTERARTEIRERREDADARWAEMCALFEDEEYGSPEDELPF